MYIYHTTSPEARKSIMSILAECTNMCIYVLLGTDDVNSGDANETNTLGTSEMNVLNARKVYALSLLWILSCTSCISNLILLLNWILLNLLLLLCSLHWFHITSLYLLKHYNMKSSSLVCLTTNVQKFMLNHYYKIWFI